MLFGVPDLEFLIVMPLALAVLVAAYSWRQHQRANPCHHGSPTEADCQECDAEEAW
jgi:hypothetical protein